LQRTNIGQTKKINNCVNPLNLQWACSSSLQLYTENDKFPLFEFVCLCDYWWCGNNESLFVKK
jgi:hypothetical protein